MPVRNYTTYTTAQLSNAPVWTTVSYTAPTSYDITWHTSPDATTASTTTAGSDYYRWIDRNYRWIDPEEWNAAEWNTTWVSIEKASEQAKKSDPEPDKEGLLDLLKA